MLVEKYWLSIKVAYNDLLIADVLEFDARQPNKHTKDEQRN